MPSDARLGVAIGISISVIFLLVLIVICAVKEPWNKELHPSLLASETNDDYLYAEKIKQIQVVSMDSSQCSSDAAISRKNSK